MNLLNSNGIRKEPRFVSKEYKQFIAEHHCFICGSKEVQVHHACYKSSGNNASDLFCVPVCVVHHNEYHSLGRFGFEELHGVKMEEITSSYMSEFCEKRGVNLQQAVVIFIESLVDELT